MSRWSRYVALLLCVSVTMCLAFMGQIMLCLLFPYRTTIGMLELTYRMAKVLIVL